MGEKTEDLEAWNARFDQAIEDGCDPAEAVARADAGAKPPPVMLAPLPPSPLRGMQPDPQAIKRRKEFERWNTELAKQKQRRAAGVAHAQAEAERRLKEFEQWNQEVQEAKHKVQQPTKHRSLNEP